MGNKDKNIRLTFYVVCGLLLGAPYIWKIIKLIPELLKTLPNAAEILASTGYTVLIIASLVVAFQALRAALAQDSRHIFDRRADSVPALNAHSGARCKRCFCRAV